MKQQSLHITSVCAVCRFILYQGLCGQLRPEWQWYEVICCFCNVGCEGAVDSCYLYYNINNKSKGLIFLILSQRIRYSFSIETSLISFVAQGNRILDRKDLLLAVWQYSNSDWPLCLNCSSIDTQWSVVLFVRSFAYVQYCAFTSVLLFSARNCYWFAN